jgi:type IV secretion system protein VirD4
MSIDELSVMDGSKCILQLRGVRPFLSDKYDITQHKNYRYLSDFDERNAFNMRKFVTRELKVKDDEEYPVFDFDATTVDMPPEAFADNKGTQPDEPEILDDTAFDPTDTELF